MYSKWILQFYAPEVSKHVNAYMMHTHNPNQQHLDPDQGLTRFRPITELLLSLNGMLSIKITRPISRELRRYLYSRRRRGGGGVGGGAPRSRSPPSPRKKRSRSRSRERRRRSRSRERHRK